MFQPEHARHLPLDAVAAARRSFAAWFTEPLDVSTERSSPRVAIGAAHGAIDAVRGSRSGPSRSSCSRWPSALFGRSRPERARERRRQPSAADGRGAAPRRCRALVPDPDLRAAADTPRSGSDATGSSSALRRRASSADGRRAMPVAALERRFWPTPTRDGLGVVRFGVTVACARRRKGDRETRRERVLPRRRVAGLRSRPARRVEWRLAARPVAPRLRTASRSSRKPPLIQLAGVAKDAQLHRAGIRPVTKSRSRPRRTPSTSSP